MATALTRPPTFDELGMDEFLRILDEEGSVTVADVVSPDYIARAKPELERAIAEEAAFHGNTDYADYGMVQTCVAYGRVFIELFENELFLEPFNQALEDTCIVYGNVSSSMPPSRDNFSTRIHVDCPRFIPNYMTNMAATILLDDFTEENGATYFLPKSHLREERPSDEQFWAEAQRLVAPAGSVWYFNTRLWHSGGENTTDIWRHALTVNLARGFVKQRFDLPRYLEHVGADMSDVSEVGLQKLGYRAQPPTRLEEYYAPRDQRTYSQPYR